MDGRRIEIQSAATATGNGRNLGVMDWAHVIFSVTGTFVGTITFEGTLDGANWTSIQAYNLSDGAVSTTTITTGLYGYSVAGLGDVRARISAYTNGSITVLARGVDEVPGLSSSGMIRSTATETAAIINGANLSGEIDFRSFSMMTIHMPAAWTPASMGFKVSTESGGTFIPLYDENGNLVQITSPAVDKAYVAPAELAAVRFVKLWSQNGSGTNTNQGAARTLEVDLKA